MIRTMELLKKYHINEIPKNNEVISLNECDYYFHVMPFKTNFQGKPKEFIDMLKTQFTSDVVYDQKGSGRYFFKTGTTIIELCVLIEKDEVNVESYLCYSKENLAKDLYKIIKLDYLLYCLLKRFDLQ